MVTYRRRIHEVLRYLLETYPNAVLVGQSIRDPYGGACKVTRGLTKQFGDRILDTPISEAMMVGVANGLALKGYIPIIEIMFSDFMTLTVDQIVNVAGKMWEHHKKDHRIIIRTMQCNDRMYGPTHCQDMSWLLKAIPHACLHDLDLKTNVKQVYEAIINWGAATASSGEDESDWSKPVHIIREYKNLYDIQCESDITQ